MSLSVKSNSFFATAGPSHSQSRKTGVSHIRAPETSAEMTSDFPSVTAGVLFILTLLIQNSMFIYYKMAIVQCYSLLL